MNIPAIPQLSPQVEAVIRRLAGGISAILSDGLIGIYLYGSLALTDGDFDPAISDIDLVAVLHAELSDSEFSRLQRLHDAVVSAFPSWRDRLEVAYISAAGLRDFQTRASTIGIISPGEPFHRLRAGRDWLISWYALRQDGIALLGPPIQQLVPPLSTSAYVNAVRQHIRRYPQSIEKAESKQALAYIILTVARGCYTVRHGAPTSKKRAAAWAATRYPHWRGLLELALRWRAGTPDAFTVAEARPRARAYTRELLDGLSPARS